MDDINELKTEHENKAAEIVDEQVTLEEADTIKEDNESKKGHESDHSNDDNYSNVSTDAYATSELNKVDPGSDNSSGDNHNASTDGYAMPEPKDAY